MESFDYDLFVIGAGSGGVRAARIAAGYGAKVAAAEEFRVGGTCVIRGCVPKKLLVYASRFASAFEDAAGFGWDVGDTRFDWPRLIAAKDRELDRLEGAYCGNLERAGVEILRTRATLAGPNAVALADGRTVSARHVLVATGARPFLPDGVPGIEHAITSNEVFDLPALPERAVVVGGGYIAVEFAGIFAGLGVETTLVYRGDHVLRGFDVELAGRLAAAMEKRGVRILTRTEVTAIERTADGLRLALTGGGTLDAGLALYATGRVPNTAGLGLEAAGVELDALGAVRVDARSGTSVPSVHAVGDVTNRVNLTPVAIREGHAFADTVFGGREVIADHGLIPTAVFSTPELGTVGLTEEQALRHHAAVDVYKAEFRPMANVLAGRDERMFMKILVDAASDRVLGVHLIGDGAGEMIQLLGIPMVMGATKRDFDRTMAVHPTAAEELVTMRSPSVRHRR
ncbi:glutathione-disulfide reductase [Oharaeibacter diazotrophicus]|uniref:Glutathione reductase n=1 Tax=Oharaeibacter diazotrophicus TaxID=1920512 RepID=A0A4R6RK07_9HYPH|nr:glutathione-disulfide reductase [Oharaeibacter diazotrophicus]TDP86247.1 NADPH-glutathione reductase [Oharaeibacter diazotrophicus]BBE71812.1 glutathione amide reductase [Pleomorphomonas sp. SM30]GLS78577.1 glutathione-disulfide reductase [Oharaeibacter diazotrophicus]